MRKIIILFAVAITMGYGCHSSSSNNEAKSADSTSFQSIDTTKLAAGASYYQCLMHPEVISDKPGNCPKCGDMALEKRVKM